MSAADLLALCLYSPFRSLRANANEQLSETVPVVKCSIMQQSMYFSYINYMEKDLVRIKNIHLSFLRSDEMMV